MVEDLECRRFRNRIDAYLDGELSAAERDELLRHAGACPDCGQLLREYETMHRMLAGLDEDLELPEEAARAWRSAVRDESERRRSARGFRWPRAVGAIAAALALVVGVTAITRGGGVRPAVSKSGDAVYTETTGYGAYDLVYEEDFADADGFSGTANTMALARSATAGGGGVLLESDGPAEDTAASRQPVVLRSASRTVQTTGFDSSSAALDELVAGCGGWFEYRSVSGKTFSEGGRGRSLDATVRVPDAGLDGFLENLRSVGSVVFSADYAQDVSDTYYDTETRLTALRAQHARLTELVTDAADLDDLILLEDKLYEVQYQIDALEGELAGLESRARYASVSVSLEEVREYEEPVVEDPSLGERIRKGFADSVAWVKGFLQDMVVTLAAIVPALVILIPVVLILWLVIRAVRRRRRR